MNKSHNSNWIEDLPKAMDRESLKTHHERLLSQKSKVTFEVVDTCTLSNSFLIDTDHIKLDPKLENDLNFTAFIPAAGAASRYMKPLSAIKNHNNYSDFIEEYNGCALPNDLSSFKQDSLKEI